MGYLDMEELSQDMESVLDVLRKGGKIEKGTETIDVLLESLDGLETLVEDVASIRKNGRAGFNSIV